MGYYNNLSLGSMSPDRSRSCPGCDCRLLPGEVGPCCSGCRAGARPAFPFTVGQRIKHPSEAWPGVVLGWIWCEGRDEGGYWVMGVRQDHPDHPGDPTRGNAIQSMVDGWVALGDDPPAEDDDPGPDILADPETVAIAAANRLAQRRRETWFVVEHRGAFCVADGDDWICYWSNEDGAAIVYTALPTP